VLAVILLSCWWSPVAAQQGNAGSVNAKVTLLQMQLSEINRQIDQAELELRSVGDFNWACCFGWNLFAPIGTVMWWLTDVQPRNDKKRELRNTISRLQSEKQSLQAQIMMLQREK
jgi:predicted  nucleic acid-binding Zn-ribbon protein